MPFAGYKNFAACVKANAGKDDPQAYCATIMRAVEKAEQEYVAQMEVIAKAKKEFVIAKIDTAERLVFGWASVARDAEGNPLEDLQGDIVPVEELEKAVYDFVLDSRVGTDLHPADDVPSGQLVESLVVTPEKLQAMGLVTKGAPQAAWWVGFKFNPETFAKVQTGDRTMFSIKGAGERVEE